MHTYFVILWQLLPVSVGQPKRWVVLEKIGLDGWDGLWDGCGLWVGAGHFHAVTAAILVWRICEIKKLLASFLPPPQPHNHRHRSQAVLPSIPASQHHPSQSPSPVVVIK